MHLHSPIVRSAHFNTRTERKHPQRTIVATIHPKKGRAPSLAARCATPPHKSTFLSQCNDAAKCELETPPAGSSRGFLGSRFSFVSIKVQRISNRRNVFNYACYVLMPACGASLFSNHFQYAVRRIEFTAPTIAGLRKATHFNVVFMVVLRFFAIPYV